MPEWNPADVASGCAEAVLISDDEGVVVALNQAGEELLGRTLREVSGRRCHEVLCGLDAFGNRYCGENCAITRMARREEPVRGFVLDVLHRSGRRLPLHVFVMRLRLDEGSGFLVVHLLVPLPPRQISGAAAELRQAVGELGSPDAETERLRSLTPREIEVLRLLATGHSSQDVANELFISLATVRTHVQNILRKLDVHSQLEAVAMAFKQGLI